MEHQKYGILELCGGFFTKMNARALLSPRLQYLFSSKQKFSIMYWNLMNSSNLIKYTKPPKTKFNLWNCGSNGKPATDPNYPIHGVFPGKVIYAKYYQHSNKSCYFAVWGAIGPSGQ